MKKMIVLLIALSIPFSAAYACTAFFKYETQGTMQKICYYDHLGDTVAITVSSVKLCPLNIQVQH